MTHDIDDVLFKYEFQFKWNENQWRKIFQLYLIRLMIAILQKNIESAIE